MSYIPPPISAGLVSYASNFVKSVDRVLVGACITLAISSLVVMLLALLAEVVVRYLTNQGLGWPSEIPNILFPWLVMSGVVLAAQQGKHIAVSAIHDLLGNRSKFGLLLALQLLSLTTFLYLGLLGFDVLEITGSEVFPVTGITSYWAYLPLILGFFGLGITAITTFALLMLESDPFSVRVDKFQDEL